MSGLHIKIKCFSAMILHAEDGIEIFIDDNDATLGVNEVTGFSDLTLETYDMTPIMDLISNDEDEDNS